MSTLEATLKRLRVLARWDAAAIVALTPTVAAKTLVNVATARDTKRA